MRHTPRRPASGRGFGKSRPSEGSTRTPGNFARICRRIFTRRDLGCWSASIIPVKRLMRAAASASLRSSCMGAEHTSIALLIR
jgi:hypothetical protein